MDENSPVAVLLAGQLVPRRRHDTMDTVAVMDTPPRDAAMQLQQQQTPQAQGTQPFPHRRSTRNALAEIPLRLNMLSVREPPRGEQGHTPAGDPARGTILGPGGGTPQGPWQLNVNVNVPASYVSPSPSPDEMIIQQRGRRRIPETWSPDLDAVKQQHQRTPVKGSPGKSGLNGGSSIVLRSTPRKRLMLDSNAKDPFTTPEKMRRMSPNSKKARSDRFASPGCEGPLDAALLALSPQQLAELVQQVMKKHPSLEPEVKEMMPLPDIRPLEDRLCDLRKNIFKSLPNSRLTSKTDSPAYTRAATHLLAFKKCLLDQMRQLVVSQNWGAVLDYVMMAWSYVRATPLWDNPPHNTCRRACFKSLTANCLAALKKGMWNVTQLERIESKLEGMIADSEEMQACLKHITAVKSK